MSAKQVIEYSGLAFGETLRLMQALQDLAYAHVNLIICPSHEQAKDFFNKFLTLMPDIVIKQKNIADRSIILSNGVKLIFVPSGDKGKVQYLGYHTIPVEQLLDDGGQDERKEDN